MCYYRTARPWHWAKAPWSNACLFSVFLMLNNSFRFPIKIHLRTALFPEITHTWCYSHSLRLDAGVLAALGTGMVAVNNVNDSLARGSLQTLFSEFSSLKLADKHTGSRLSAPRTIGTSRTRMITWGLEGSDTPAVLKRHTALLPFGSNIRE